MIQFKHGPGGRVEKHWDAAHPDLKKLLTDFDEMCLREEMHPPVITELYRSAEEQVAYYSGYYKQVRDAAKPGGGFRITLSDGSSRPVTFNETLLGRELIHATDADLRKRAAERFTWHWVNCAADLRMRDPETGTRLYSDTPKYRSSRKRSQSDLDIVKEFFRTRCRKPDWEWLIHDITSPHLHVGRRCFEWRKQQLEKLGGTPQ